MIAELYQCNDLSPEIGLLPSTDIENILKDET